jgi:hypothetical protein
MNRYLQVGPGGINCRCCLPPRGSKARRYQFRRAKRRETRAAFAAQDDENGWYCAFGCGRLIEEHENGPYCQQCRWYTESYEALIEDEYYSRIDDMLLYGTGIDTPSGIIGQMVSDRLNTEVTKFTPPNRGHHSEN